MIEATARDILVVDDDIATLEVVSLHLSQAGYHPLCADSGVQALRMFSEYQPGVIISDWLMPRMDGLEVCRQVRGRQENAAIYFIMLTVQSDKDRLMEAFNQGVDDFLSKPFHAGELLARVRAGGRMIDLYHQLRGQTAMLQRSNEELSRLNDRLRRTASTDELTGLLNRRQAMLRLREHWALSLRTGQPLSVAMVDVDHFKRVNDTYGHLKGDEVLQKLAAALSQNVRSADLVFRMGGEEFLILFPRNSLAEASVSAERCRTVVPEAVTVHAASGESITISVGLAEKGPSMQAVDDLLKAADDALYAAKRAGRNRVEPVVQRSHSPLADSDQETTTTRGTAVGLPGEATGSFPGGSWLP